MTGPDNIHRLPQTLEQARRRANLMPGELDPEAEVLQACLDMLDSVDEALDLFGVPKVEIVEGVHGTGPAGSVSLSPAERARRAFDVSRGDLLRQLIKTDPKELRRLLNEASGAPANEPARRWRVKMITPDLGGPLFGIRWNRRRVAIYALPFGGLEVFWPG